jgi:hypothetical protein
VAGLKGPRLAYGCPIRLTPRILEVRFGIIETLGRILFLSFWKPGERDKWEWTRTELGLGRKKNEMSFLSPSSSKAFLFVLLQPLNQRIKPEI